MQLRSTYPPCLSSRTQSYISFCNSSIYTMCKFLLMVFANSFMWFRSSTCLEILSFAAMDRSGRKNWYSQNMAFHCLSKVYRHNLKHAVSWRPSRLSRPGIIKPTNDLATVQSWSKGDDKRLLRLIQYIDSTPHHRLVGTINDSPEQLGLRLYVDADFAGVRLSAKSTSGVFLILYGPNTIFPLAWVSKRQTSTSRSTTESEVVPLAHSLYQEGLQKLQLWELLLGRSVVLKLLEDNQATILVVRKGYPSKLRRIARTHKINMSGLSEVFQDDSAKLEYCKTDDQAADIFTKALPPQKWGPALRLLGIRTDLQSELKPKTEWAAPTGPK